MSISLLTIEEMDELWTFDKKGQTMHTFCEYCETEELQDDPQAIADICDSCVDNAEYARIDETCGE